MSVSFKSLLITHTFYVSLSLSLSLSNVLEAPKRKVKSWSIFAFKSIELKIDFLLFPLETFKSYETQKGFNLIRDHLRFNRFQSIYFQIECFFPFRCTKPILPTTTEL